MLQSHIDIEFYAKNLTENGGEITYRSSNPSVAAVNSDTGNITANSFGTTIITATAARVDGTLGATSLSYTLNVAKKQVKVKIQNKSKRYSNENLDFTYLIQNVDAPNDDTADSGLIMGDGVEAVTMKLTTEAGNLSDVGAYPITGEFEKSNNTATFKNYTDAESTLTVEPADKQTPDITGISVKDKEYDGKPAVMEGKVMVDGRSVNDSTFESYRESVIGSPLSVLPKYPGFYILKITVPERGEYELGSREVKFNIYKRNLTVKPNDITITAGQTPPAYSLYDVRTQHVMFMTYHLSKYVISYEEWKNLFQDVKEDNWYYLAVKFIAERSLMRSGWALPGLQWAKGNGIINGKSGGLGVSERLLDPKGNATRAEIAVILKGFIERQNKF